MKDFQACHVSDPDKIGGSVCCGFCERATVEITEGDTTLMVGVQGRSQWPTFVAALRRAADEIEASELQQATTLAEALA